MDLNSPLGSLIPVTFKEKKNLESHPTSAYAVNSPQSLCFAMGIFRFMNFM